MWRERAAIYSRFSERFARWTVTSRQAGRCSVVFDAIKPVLFATCAGALLATVVLQVKAIRSAPRRAPHWRQRCRRGVAAAIDPIQALREE